MVDLPQKIRILVVDDNSDIHEDIRKILCSRKSTPALNALEKQLLGESPSSTSPQEMEFEIDSAYQGDEAVARAQKAVREHRPYTLTFVDMRMPPGQDGLQTILQIWEFDPEIQVVCCSAYADYSWNQMLQATGITDRLVFLRKPYDAFEVLQLAHTLATKWQLQRNQRDRLVAAEARLSERTHALEQCEAMLRVVVDTSSDTVLIVGPDGVPALSSPSFKAALAASDVGLSACTLVSRAHPEDVAALQAAMDRAIAAEPSRAFTCRLRAAGGGWKQFELRAQAGQVGAGKSAHILLSGRILPDEGSQTTT